MNRLLLPICAALVALATSCADEIGKDIPQGISVTLTAYAPEDDIGWRPSDEIKVFYNTSGFLFNTKVSEEVPLADFTGTLNVVLSTAGEKEIRAVYPYLPGAVSDGRSIMTTLPSEQYAVAGSIDRNTCIYASKSKSTNLEFYNVCGGIGFTLVNDNIKEITMEGLDEEDLAGKVKIDFDGEIPYISELADGKGSIRLRLQNGASFAKNKWYYIVTAPCSLSEGFSLTFSDGERKQTLEYDELEIEGGVFESFEDVDEDLDEDLDFDESESEFIDFSDGNAKEACVSMFDVNGDDEVSYEEVSGVTDIRGLFIGHSEVESFDELQYFVSLASLDNSLCGLTLLESVVIPRSVTTIQSNAFDGCTSLSSVSFETEKLDFIGDNVFRDCTSLESIELPEVRSIGGYAFSGCSSLESVEFPDCLEYIGPYCFRNCTSLEELEVPESVREIGDGLVSGCTSLTSVSLPSGLKSIPPYTFCGCVALSDFSIPENVRSIGDDAFNGCYMFNDGVSVLELPASVREIGRDNFTKVRCVIVNSNSPVSVGNGAFGDYARIYVPSGMLKMYGGRLAWSAYSNRLFSIDDYSENPLGEAPEGTVDMGTSVFWATCNLGASAPEEKGGYYQWAGSEDVAQTDYELNWNNCPYHLGIEQSAGWTRYIPESMSGYWSGGSAPDNARILSTEDDIAHKELQGNFRIPTASEWEELLKVCKWTSTVMNGIGGRLIVSPYTGESIFLPAAGSRYDNESSNVGSSGFYWSSTVDDKSPDFARLLYFYNGPIYTLNLSRRYVGRSVRPVSD